MRTIRIGSRGSKLALWQAEHVRTRLAQAWPDASFEVQVIQTRADKHADLPLSKLGDKSLFIKEIEEALLAGSVDIAVHSLKDVPSTLDDRFLLAAFPEREDPRDAILTRSGRGDLRTLAEGATVGTSSLRRQAQLRAVRSDLRCVPLRGNVDTRVRKLMEGHCDAIVLASAGLHRLGYEVSGSAYLDPSVCVPAPGQAALCLEVKRAGSEAARIAAVLDHGPTRTCVEAERSFAAALDFGCEIPLGALAHLGPDGRSIHLETVVAAADGSRVIRTSGDGQDADFLGRQVAAEAKAHGAEELLAGVRR